jgi:catechol 2,3-dioxygenase-like lactoylglutathione lyase family enzyme
MIDHITLRVRSLAATRAFYAQALAPLGYRLGYDAVHEGVGVVGFGADVAGIGSRVAVDAFHAAAIAAGGKDNGPPGVRDHYHPNYYGAFALDPDGNNIEAVCHAPA